METKVGDTNTKMLWYGTAAMPTEIIYAGEYGFTIAYSNDKGLFGCGLYFSRDAEYSDANRHYIQNPKEIGYN